MRVMTTILVSLISDQTIPNILAIEHFKPDELLFVTTEEMERKNKVPAIMSTLDRLGLKYADRSSKITVQEDSILDCHREMDRWIQEREDAEFIINLTCGTRIMSIAAHEFFKDYSSKMVLYEDAFQDLKQLIFDAFERDVDIKLLRVSVIQ